MLEQLQFDILMLEDTRTQEQATQKTVQSLQNIQLADIEQRRYEDSVTRQWQMGGEDNSLRFIHVTVCLANLKCLG